MPISKRNTQAHAAYVQIKQRILGGQLAGSDRLREVEVAEMLGLGRTPVRESLKRLEEEGLLTHEPRRGLVVTSLDQQAVTELYAMREVLEAAAAGFAARNATPAEIANLELILAEYGPDTDAVALNLDFHQAIYGAAHNRHLIRSLRSISDTTYLLGRSTLASRARADVAQQEHLAILAAIRDRDAARASEAARQHIHNALLERLKLLRQLQKQEAAPA